uniref:Uncharacterized protein n=1 Tax=Steinernema glaseri TaxID=37863 RepID=A0A1I7Z233_9BILA
MLTSHQNATQEGLKRLWRPRGPHGGRGSLLVLFGVARSSQTTPNKQDANDAEDANNPEGGEGINSAMVTELRQRLCPTLWRFLISEPKPVFAGRTWGQSRGKREKKAPSFGTWTRVLGIGLWHLKVGLRGSKEMDDGQVEPGRASHRLRSPTQEKGPNLSPLSTPGP